MANKNTYEKHKDLIKFIKNSILPLIKNGVSHNDIEYYLKKSFLIESYNFYVKKYYKTTLITAIHKLNQKDLLYFAETEKNFQDYKFNIEKHDPYKWRNIKI
ncbi:MAG: hypothetical protein NZZ41_03995 [Candidatus Dojkabacteria bacterium]|nr:hypothetical protein [Candidatus Dojkabacteria bacterium]